MNIRHIITIIFSGIIVIFLSIVLIYYQKDKENQYIIELTYNNGSKDTISLFTNNYQNIYLDHGDLKCIHYNDNYAINSGVRDYSIINIIKTK